MTETKELSVPAPLEPASGSLEAVIAAFSKLSTPLDTVADFHEWSTEQRIFAYGVLVGRVYMGMKHDASRFLLAIHGPSPSGKTTLGRVAYTGLSWRDTAQMWPERDHDPRRELAPCVLPTARIVECFGYSIGDLKILLPHILGTDSKATPHPLVILNSHARKDPAHWEQLSDLVGPHLVCIRLDKRLARSNMSKRLWLDLAKAKDDIVRKGVWAYCILLAQTTKGQIPVPKAWQS